MLPGRCRFFFHWSNDAGGTAGAGANNLQALVPFPYLSTIFGDDRGCVGFGEWFESAGTICAMSVHADNTVSTTAIRFKNVTSQAPLTCADQSSTLRWVSAQGEYEI